METDLGGHGFGRGHAIRIKGGGVGGGILLSHADLLGVHRHAHAPRHVLQDGRVHARVHFHHLCGAGGGGEMIADVVSDEESLGGWSWA